MQAVILIVFFGMLIFALRAIILSGKKKKIPLTALPVSEAVLEEHVRFYRSLPFHEKARFRRKMINFLETVRITPVNTEINDLDKALVAASAVIPMFSFDDWTYPHLEEVLIYNDRFNMNFETAGEEQRDILGMVGNGVYKNKMLLSKLALQEGFRNDTDRSNTAIHEFVHLIDGADGDTDGIPRLLLDKRYVLPWIGLIHEEMEKMKDEDSDMNPYGYTNKTEFFAVAAEYFFEHPELFKEKHPELYSMMQKMFRTK